MKVEEYSRYLETLDLTMAGFYASSKEERKDAPVLVALHGWLDNCASFFPLLPFLTKHFQVYCLDLIGHGFSDHLPKSSSYHMLGYGQQMIEFLKIFPEPVHLLGHSLGGGVAMVICGTIPSKIASLMLIESVGPFSYDPKETLSRFRNYVSRYSQKLGTQTRVYETIEDAVKVRTAQSKLELSYSELICKRGMKKIPMGYTWNSDPRLFLPAPCSLSEEEMGVFVENISCPVGLIKGSNGFNFEKYADRMTRIKNLKQATVPGGHHVHMEQPKEVAQVLFKMWRNYV